MKAIKKKAEIDGAFLLGIITSKVLETAILIKKIALENEAHLIGFIRSEEKLFQDLVTY